MSLELLRVGEFVHRERFIRRGQSSCVASSFGFTRRVLSTSQSCLAAYFVRNTDETTSTRFPCDEKITHRSLAQLADTRRHNARPP